MSKDIREEPMATKEGAARQTPDQWAIECGEVLDVRGIMSPAGHSPSNKSAAHRGAATLHGWELHKMHSAEPLTMTRSDYEAALAAAMAPPPGENCLKAHGPACTPYLPKKG